MRDYKKMTKHAVNADIEYIYIWSNPNDAWDYTKIDITVEEDEFLVQEINETVRQGRYIAIKSDIIEQLLNNNIIESLN